MFVGQDIIHTNIIVGSSSNISYAVNDIGLYSFALNSALSRDMVSNTSMPPANYTTPHWEFDAAGELVEYGVDEYVKDRYGEILTYGSGKQMCLWSEDAGEWAVVSSPTITDTGGTIGPFKKIEIVDGGSVSDAVKGYESTASGSLPAKMYGCLYYIEGSSNKLSLVCKDITSATESVYEGTIGSASVTKTDAGTLTILSDEQDDVLGCRVLQFTIEFTNYDTDDFQIVIGPYSYDNSSIFILGADVFDTDTYRPHIPSLGSTVVFSSTYADSDVGPRMAFTDIPLVKASLESQGELEWQGRFYFP